MNFFRLIIISLFFSFQAYSQEFTIDSLEIEAHLQTDGSIEVTEKINFEFTKNNSQIIKLLPTQFHIRFIPDSLKSLRAEPTSSHFIKFYDIKVENFKYEIFETYNTLQINILSKDEYFAKKQKIIIHYKISSLINPYKKYDELEWQWIENNWNTEIKNLRLGFYLPRNTKIDKKNLLLQKNNRNSEDNFFYQTLENKIFIKSNFPLQKQENLTFRLKLPKNYIKSAYKIKNINRFIKINPNGSCNFIDSLEVVFTNFQNGFIYEIARFAKNKHEKTDIFLKFLTEKNPYKIQIREKSDTYQFHIGSATNEKFFSGKQIIRLEYQTWGNLISENELNYFSLNFPPFNALLEPINQNIFIQNNSYSNSYKIIKHEKLYSNYKIDTGIYRIKNLKYKALENLTLQLPKATIEKIPNTEILKNSQLYYTNNLNIRIKILRNKTVEVRKEIENFYFHSYKKGEIFPFEHKIPLKIFTTDFNFNSSNSFITSRNVLFTDIYKPYYSKIEFSANSLKKQNSNEITINWLAQYHNQTESKVYICTKIYDIVNQTDTGTFVNIPLLTQSNESVLQTNISIEFENVVNDEKMLFTILAEDTLFKINRFTFVNNTFNANLSLIKGQHTPFSIFIKIPDNYFNRFSLISEINLFLLNNTSLLLPILTLIILLIMNSLLKYLKSKPIIESSKIPTKLSLLEVDFLWNKKIKKGILLATILEWKLQNIIEINKTDTDFELLAINKLAKGKNKIEKTLYKKIFKNKKNISFQNDAKIISHALQKSFNQAIRYIKFNNFLTPGTLGFSKLLKLLALFFLFGSLIFFIQTFTLNQLAVSFFLTSTFLAAFDFIIPQKRHVKNRLHHELLAFSQFIQNTKNQEINTDYTTLTQYFLNGLTYAIVLNKTQNWIEKFENRTLISPFSNNEENAQNIANEYITLLNEIEAKLLNKKKSNFFKQKNKNEIWSPSKLF